PIPLFSSFPTTGLSRLQLCSSCDGGAPVGPRGTIPPGTSQPPYLAAYSSSTLRAGKAESSNEWILRRFLACILCYFGAQFVMKRLFLPSAKNGAYPPC